MFKMGMMLLTAAGLCGLLTGCAAVQSLTSATINKTVAMGSDTWGGGGDATAASAETPVPSISFWFGRRKVWYTSVKDKDTGEAAAKVVKASNSALKVSAGADGIGAKQ